MWKVSQFYEYDLDLLRHTVRMPLAELRSCFRGGDLGRFFETKNIGLNSRPHATRAGVLLRPPIKKALLLQGLFYTFLLGASGPPRGKLRLSFRGGDLGRFFETKNIGLNSRPHATRAGGVLRPPIKKALLLQGLFYTFLLGASGLEPPKTEV